LARDVILATDGLTMEFRGFRAVNGVALQVERGTIHALIGPNGAGKTTCFNLLTKFLIPTAGTIRYKDRDITGLKAADVARLGLVRSFQISAVFPHLTVMENVRIALQRRRRGDSFDFWRAERVLRALNGEALALVEAVGLSDFADVLAANSQIDAVFSMDDETSIGVLQAIEEANRTDTPLALDPEMRLRDEPMAGMGHEDVDRTAALIRRVSKDRTILMVEHNLSVVASLSDRITVLARGQVLAEGDYATVSKDPRVVEAYIGAGHA